MAIRIALAGNPNCGKTTLFNELTGSSQYVGNWPGVTVEKKDGILKGHKDVIIQDLPGIYSLSPYTMEEKVARNYLVNEQPDAILNIIDGTNLERNLYLSTQLIEIGLPVSLQDLGVNENTDLKEIADFMNMHNGRFMNIWKGYCSEDSIPNIEKLALFVRSIKRIDKLNFYKNLGEKEWENCIDGIIRKPREVVRALMEYKYDSSKINGAISFGTSSEKIKRQIQAIEKYLDNQTLKHDMEVYRGEGRFDVFNSVVLDKEKNITLKDILEKFTANIEEHKFNEKAVDDFVDKSLLGQYIH